MNGRTSYEVICDYMPERVRQAMLRVKEKDRLKVSEIRMHSGRAVSFVYPDRIRYLSARGDLESSSRYSGLVNVTASELGQTVNSLAHYSMHSCTRELRQGFFVISGGVRVGLSGTFSDTESGALRDWNGICFRIPRQVIGCAESIFPRMLGSSSGLLICGGVNSGKTTLLRDLCRLCADSCKVTLIDERNEIAALAGGTPTYDVGQLTDVVAGCRRSDGVERAVRTLSPDMIFCDEISGDSDSAAILSGAGSGVRFAATIHADDMEGLLKRQFVQCLIDSDVFDYAVFLVGSSDPGKIREVRKLC